MNDVRENLKAFLDGQLPPEQARQVQEALAADAGLRREFDEMRRISSTLREGAVNPPVTGLDRTLSLLAARNAPAKPTFFRFLPAAAIAGACLVALVVIGRINQPEVAFNDSAPMPLSKEPGRAARLNARVGGWDKDQGGRGGKFDPGRSDTTSSPPKLAKSDNEMFAGEPRPEAGVALDSSAPAPKPASQGVQIASPQIVRTGHLEMAVSNAKDSVAQATTAAKSLGGYVESSNVSGEEKSGVTGTLTIRVPVTNFDSAFNRLRALGKVSAESTNGQDVTGQIVDTDARLKVMRTEEQAYVDILAKAKHVEDVLSVRDRLDTVRQDIESMAAQSKALKEQAALSTIDITFDQKPLDKPAGAGMASKHDDWLAGTWAFAWNGLAQAGRTLTQALIYLVVFCPIWIPFVLLANYFTKRVRHFA